MSRATRARTTTGFYCGQQTKYYNLSCGEVGRFLIGLPGEDGISSCAAHLAKAVRAEAERLETKVLMVKPLEAKETEK